MAASSDGVVTATVMSDGATILLAVDFTVAGSPIVGTAGNVYSLTVYGATSTAALATAATAASAAWSVRGLSAASAPGGALVGVDHEAPFATTLYYKAFAYGVTGLLLGSSTTVSITLPAPFGFGMWLKSLSIPSLSVNPTPSGPPTWAAGIAQNAIWIEGRPDPIVTMGVRQFKTTTMTAYTLTAADATDMELLLASPGPYLLQLPGTGQPDRYVTVGSYTQVGMPSADPTQTWTLPLTQVIRPPVAGWSVAVPGKTYADSQAALPLYSNRTGTYKSRAV